MIACKGMWSGHISVVTGGEHHHDPVSSIGATPEQDFGKLPLALTNCLSGHLGQLAQIACRLPLHARILPLLRIHQKPASADTAYSAVRAVLHQLSFWNSSTGQMSQSIAAR